MLTLQKVIHLTISFYFLNFILVQIDELWSVYAPMGLLHFSMLQCDAVPGANSSW